MARDVFKDIFAVGWSDDGQDDGEDRFVTVGMVEQVAVRLLHHSRRKNSHHLGQIGVTL